MNQLTEAGKSTKIIMDHDNDRVIYVTYTNGQFIGLNFHQGIDEDMPDKYNHPCVLLTSIYNKISNNDMFYDERHIINTAIDFYIYKYIYKLNIDINF